MNCLKPDWGVSRLIIVRVIQKDSQSDSLDGAGQRNRQQRAIPKDTGIDLLEGIGEENVRKQEIP
jgi:hypothetical protein